MKKLFVLLLAVLTICMTGCNDEVRTLEGSYSYKISGVVEVDWDEVNLADEIGAMDIVRIDTETALLTFNAINGGVYHTTAQINDKAITLKRFERDITLRAQNYHINVSGKGDVYDQTIIFSLKYESDDVSTQSIEMLCKRNK